MESKQEAEVTKDISNETVCSYFYAMFVLVCVFAALVLAMDIWVMTKNPRAGVIMLVRSVIFLSISIANAMFLYILCARTLLK